MHLIRLTENIPKDLEGRQYPFLGVTQITGVFPVDPSRTARKAQLTLTIQPYQIITLEGSIIRLPHPTEVRKLEISNFNPGNQPELVKLSAELVRTLISEWSSATIEVLE